MSVTLRETNDAFILEGVVQCAACNGTGLYRGLCERDGAAVICHQCDGTGQVVIHQVFNKFKGLVKRNDVERVFEHAGGYVISSNDVTVDGKVLEFSKCGVSYKDWFDNGISPKPLECIHCPFIHAKQALDREDDTGLYRIRCADGLSGLGTISNCKFMPEKDKCWKIYKCEKN